MAPDSLARIEVVRTHLELRRDERVDGSAAPDDTARLVLRVGMRGSEYLPIYAAVGGPWRWRDRLAWSDDQLDAYLGSRDIFVWTLQIGDQIAGFFELQRHSDEHVEILYFGLVQSFIGRGLGGWLLARAIEESFALGAERVTLHTCTLDSPHALPNYLARGFTAVREERFWVPAE